MGSAQNFRDRLNGDMPRAAVAAWLGSRRGPRGCGPVGGVAAESLRNRIRQQPNRLLRSATVAWIEGWTPTATAAPVHAPGPAGFRWCHVGDSGRFVDCLLRADQGGFRRRGRPRHMMDVGRLYPYYTGHHKEHVGLWCYYRYGLLLWLLMRWHRLVPRGWCGPAWTWHISRRTAI